MALQEKSLLNKKVHTHGILIQVSVFEKGKKVYHYTSFNHCQSWEKSRIIMRKTPDQKVILKKAETSQKIYRVVNYSTRQLTHQFHSRLSETVAFRSRHKVTLHFSQFFFYLCLISCCHFWLMKLMLRPKD